MAMAKHDLEVVFQDHNVRHQRCVLSYYLVKISIDHHISYLHCHKGDYLVCYGKYDDLNFQ